MNPLQIIAVFLFSIATPLFAEPTLKQKTVLELSKAILELPQYVKYKEKFKTDEVRFDNKSKVWHVTPRHFPVTPGGAGYFFEIQDSGARFRIGSISGIGFDPKSSEHFRIPPAARKTIKKILKQQ